MRHQDPNQDGKQKKENPPPDVKSIFSRHTYPPIIKASAAYRELVHYP